VTDLAVPRGKLLGARVKRVEDPRFLTGEARYLADLTLPRMMHAAFLRSPHGHAHITSIDTSAAEAMPGVLAVLSGADVETFPLADIVPIEGLAKTPQTVLAIDKVRFVGEAVAVVVASDRYVAEDAVEAIAVEYEELPAVTSVEAALADGAPVLHEALGENVVLRNKRTFGDVDGAFAQAHRVFEHEIHTNRHAAAPMETRGCIAEYERAAGKMTVWSSTQTPELLRITLAPVLGLPAQKLRVVAPAVGGGFGQKMATYPEEVVVTYLARKLGRPVKWVEDRRENLMSATHAKEQVVKLAIAVDQNGHFLAMRARYVGDSGAYSFNSASAVIEPMLAATLMPSVYDVRNYEWDIVCALTNKTPIGPYRAVGWTAGHTARELLIDKIARELGIDPAELRRRNLVKELPYESCTGGTYDSGNFVQSLDKALETIDYEGFRREQEEARKQGRYLGIGISPYVEPTGVGSEVALQVGLPLGSHDNATVTIDPTGKVTVATSVASQGQGHETSFAQLAADALGATLEDVQIVQADTDRTPFGMGTYGSRSAVIGGGSLSLAAREVREKLLHVASVLLEASPGDLVLEDSRVHVAGSPERGMGFADVAGAAYFAPFVRREGSDPYLSSTRFYDPRATYSNGCFVAIAEVDIETGKTTLHRVLAVEDCGTMLNPMIVEGQVRGAIAQGIGSALLEHLVYDESGQLLTTTYLDFLLPTATEVPRLDVEHIETPSPVTVGGIKGMGESGLIASPAAVLNAIIDAVSPFDPQITELPLSPDRVLRAIGKIS
jgi:carbon-monoxide dehydrogenase large subunit